MWFDKFSRAISSALPAAALFDLDALRALDPEKIYVENVRSVLRVPHQVAVAICEAAVRQGTFKKFVAVECPNGAQGAEAEFGQALPPTVMCDEDHDGFITEVEVSTEGLPRVTFYRLANG